MKRYVAVLCLGVLVLGLLLVVGCGGGKTTEDETQGEHETEVVSLDEDVETGIVGTYKDNMGRPGSIVFTKDGTFEGDAWGSSRKGTYEVEDAEDDRSVVVLTFDDGGAEETWYVGISMGKVAAVTNPQEGTQYDKVVE